MHSLEASMSRRGEKFFHMLKSEWIRRKTYATRKEARHDVFDYIKLLYNPNNKQTKSVETTLPLP